MRSESSLRLSEGLSRSNELRTARPFASDRTVYRAFAVLLRETRFGNVERRLHEGGGLSGRGRTSRGHGPSGTLSRRAPRSARPGDDFGRSELLHEIGAGVDVRGDEMGAAHRRGALERPAQLALGRDLV